MENAFYLTLSQAAKETGKSKSVIFKAIKSGKISVVEKTSEGYKLDPAELFRAFPRTTDNAKKEQTSTHMNDQETVFLRRENELLRDQLKREQEQTDHWRQQATFLLTHQTEVKPEPEVSKLWLKLFGNRK